MRRAGIPALAAVGRERGNPRSERSEPAALKVQLGEGAEMLQSVHIVSDSGFYSRVSLGVGAPLCG